MTFIRWMCRLIGINASFLSFLSLAGLKHVPGMEELMLVQFMKCVIQKRKAVTALPLRKIWTILAKWGIKFLWSWWVMYIWKYLFVFTHLVLIKGSTLSCLCKTKLFKSNMTNMSWLDFLDFPLQRIQRAPVLRASYNARLSGASTFTPMNCNSPRNKA